MDVRRYKRRRGRRASTRTGRPEGILRGVGRHYDRSCAGAVFITGRPLVREVVLPTTGVVK